MAYPVITQTSSERFKPTKQGKVRDLYDLSDSLLIVATDRISAFDVILPDGIPNKGRVLTQISAFWFRHLSAVVGNHIITTKVTEFPEPFRSAPEIFGGRSMLTKKLKPIEVECVVRGYISGSGWSEYKKSKSICGITLPDGLRESDKLSEPIFTPTTKAPIGTHDENISFDDVVNLVGKELATKLRDLTIGLYTKGAEYAAGKGIIIADTKFEFGLDENGEVVWIDEALTPDSSRFWPMDRYKPGSAQPSFDKQFVRDYLLSIQWNKQPPPPKLPEEIIRTTSRKYEEALKLLTGKPVA
ncbi:MAG: phosphoribosylaminoimidazolesuccinocarboxamide synthase [Bacteroidetes bacterium]|nr:phosphoribosylaminoimidazolesuccinocarboxamide synthase [Bacteroidota bacterium]MCW5896936.1 phosphoribosylaminoimidazolesuccinocarboxamide synthase [Bacteroidota bacterium]